MQGLHAGRTDRRGRAGPSTPRHLPLHLPQWNVPAARALHTPQCPAFALRPVPMQRSARASPGGTASWALCPFLTVNASRGRVPFGSCGSSDEPGAFQELDENSVHERVLDQGLYQHHSLLPQHVQHPWDV